MSGNAVFRPFNPITRWDNVLGYTEKPEKVTLEQGELPAAAPIDALEALEYDPALKRDLDIHSPVLKELSKIKIRSAFIQSIDHAGNNGEYLERLAGHLHEMGINLVQGVIQGSAYDGMKTDESRKKLLSDLRYTLTIFRKNNIAVIAGTNLPNSQYFQSKPYSKVTTIDGVESGSPSPLDREFWADAVLPLAKELAKLSKEFPSTIIGSFWDTELYGFESLTITEAFSFDNVTFGEFLRKREKHLGRLGIYEEAKTLPQYRRFAWLKEQGLLKQYYQSLEEGVEEIGKWMDHEVSAINPDFLWTFYAPGIPQGWYYKGLFRGLSSRKRPVLLITYDARGVQQVDYNAQHGIFLMHCPGTLLNSVKSEQWIGCLTGIAKNEDGYWLFPGGSLMMDDGWRYGRHDWSILQPPEDLFKWIREANRLIGEYNATH